MPTSKPLSDKRRQTRERLIEAAARAIAKKGFRDTTLDEIAADAGLTKGAIYDNFKNKDALFMEVMRARPSKLPLPAGQEGAVEDRLRAMAKAVVADGEAQRLQIPLRAEFLLYSLGHPQMRGQVEAWLKAGFEGERERLPDAFAPGELSLSPDAFVVMLQAMIPGLMYLRSQAPDLVSDAVVAEIFEAMARGATRPPPC